MLCLLIRGNGCPGGVPRSRPAFLPGRWRGNVSREQVREGLAAGGRRQRRSGYRCAQRNRRRQVKYRSAAGSLVGIVCRKILNASRQYRSKCPQYSRVLLRGNGDRQKGVPADGGKSSYSKKQIGRRGCNAPSPKGQCPSIPSSPIGHLFWHSGKMQRGNFHCCKALR